MTQEDDSLVDRDAFDSLPELPQGVADQGGVVVGAHRPAEQVPGGQVDDAG
jgi:hypothetical protein